jgi:hypothetical protein
MTRIRLPGAMAVGLVGLGLNSAVVFFKIGLGFYERSFLKYVFLKLMVKWVLMKMDWIGSG